MVKDEDIFEAFQICLRHKRSSPSAIKYMAHYQEDLIELVDELNERKYRPTTSTAFIVTRPKVREVFAAAFRDRIVHHYLAMRVEPLLEQVFSPRTFNCRKGKGTLYGIHQLEADMYACSEKYTKDCYIMRLDLQGFFMSIDKKLLNDMTQKFIQDNYFGVDKEDVLWISDLLVMHEPEKNCIKASPDEAWKPLPKNKSLFTNGEGRGLPIGNLPSQLYANFYLHHLDMLLEKLGFAYHGRYVDDFYVFHTDKQKMLQSVPIIRRWLSLYLHITLHPNKFYFQHYSKGVKFTGAVVKPGRIYAGDRTVNGLKDALWALEKATIPYHVNKVLPRINSYMGALKHFKSYSIRREIFKNLSASVWDKIYVTKHFCVVKMRKHWRPRQVPKEEWIKVYYMNDPIGDIYEILGLQNEGEKEVTAELPLFF